MKLPPVKIIKTPRPYKERPRSYKCTDCDGTGEHEDGGACPTCGGEGKIKM